MKEDANMTTSTQQEPLITNLGLVSGDAHVTEPRNLIGFRLRRGAVDDGSPVGDTDPEQGGRS